MGAEFHRRLKRPHPPHPFDILGISTLNNKVTTTTVATTTYTTTTTFTTTATNLNTTIHNPDSTKDYKKKEQAEATPAAKRHHYCGTDCSTQQHQRLHRNCSARRALDFSLAACDGSTGLAFAQLWYPPASNPLTAITPQGLAPSPLTAPASTQGKPRQVSLPPPPAVAPAAALAARDIGTARPAPTVAGPTTIAGTTPLLGCTAGNSGRPLLITIRIIPGPATAATAAPVPVPPPTNPTTSNRQPPVDSAVNCPYCADCTHCYGVWVQESPYTKAIFRPDLDKHCQHCTRYGHC